MQEAHRLGHSRSLLPAIAMGLAISAVSVPAVAQSGVTPTQKRVEVDWPSVARDVRALSPNLVAPPPSVDARSLSEAGQELSRYAFADKEAIRPLAHLNAFMATAYPGIATVPIPVLAPVAAMLSDESRLLTA